ncbi:GNAT family protein [Phycicoccus sp. 3266]|uniref:GNAT family N-acetyltransferase n=1 Tax=Phycicoccus sp. 3266 TaxID=2817751 RepID=UPI0028664752|nr:GNAT family protein [Phycicoccus sp. 3266]MDR6862542.1 ribosomal-protein-alanine N-acetyltransferase [Phycicoccus sp. 3266]
MAQPRGRVTRLVRESDAEVLAELLVANRDFLAPTMPDRPAGYDTVDGQRELVASLLAEHRAGTRLPLVVLDEDDAVVGRITLNEIVRGPSQSANVGYWLAERAGARGLATAALREVVDLAFGELGLHRLQAGTLLDNVRSQRVLLRAGFTVIGDAPSYLHIAGRWADHRLFQLVSDR